MTTIIFHNKNHSRFLGILATSRGHAYIVEKCKISQNVVGILLLNRNLSNLKKTSKHV